MSDQHDVFGSEKRRQAQAAKDVRETAAPVSNPYRPEGFLALRPLEERLAARTPKSRNVYEQADNRERKKRNRARARKRRFHHPVSEKSTAIGRRS